MAAADFPGLNAAKAVFESLSTIKSNNEYPPAVLPRCVPYILKYLAVAAGKVSSVTQRNPALEVL
jgi:hypothetical protein